MSDHGEGTWVSANRDFAYDDKVGKVLRGQVFQMGGHRNDGQLLGFNFMSVMEPQPSKNTLMKLPKCGECGRVYLDGVYRDNCGMSHELSPREVAEERRYKAHDTVLDAQIAQDG